MIGTVYFDQARGSTCFVNDVLPRNIAHRPVTIVRPLTVGAPQTDEFDCLAPMEWNAKQVLGDLFARYEFEACGWDQRRTTLNVGGGDLDYKFWTVTK